MGNYGKIWFLRMEIAVYHIDLGYTKSNGNMTEDFSPKALVVVERLLELLG